MPLNRFSSIRKFNTKNVKIKLYIILIQHMLLTLTYIVNRVFFYYVVGPLMGSTEFLGSCRAKAGKPEVAKGSTPFYIYKHVYNFIKIYRSHFTLLFLFKTLERFFGNAVSYHATLGDTDLPDGRSRVSTRLHSRTRVFLRDAISDVMTDSPSPCARHF